MADSAYGKGFAIRMIVLLVLLGLVAAGFYYDRQLQANAKSMINDLYSMSTGAAVSKEEVKEKIGFAPSETKTVDKFEVERYTFGRVLPFTKGEYVEVAYRNGYLDQVADNKEFKPLNVEDLKPYTPPAEEHDEKCIAQ